VVWSCTGKKDFVFLHECAAADVPKLESRRWIDFYTVLFFVFYFDGLGFLDFFHSEPVWTLKRREKYCPHWDSNHGHPAGSPSL
jgi:hypothetical protein